MTYYVLSSWRILGIFVYDTASTARNRSTKRDRALSAATA
jgi:hypothetical protein